MMNQKELISVVIAAYNLEDYISECLDSVLMQTYGNIEVIVVNDGSTDRTSSVIEGYLEKDPRVVLINVENGGAARARNIGIDKSTGMYLSIVDGDDTVEPTFLNDLYVALHKNGADISSCEYYYSYEDDRAKKVRGNRSLVEELVMSRDEVLRDYLSESSLMQPVFWNKLYKISIFKDNKLSIPEGDIYEDSRVLYKIYHYVNKLSYQSKPLYNYLQREDSVMGTKITQKNIVALRSMIEEVKLWMRDKYGKDYDKDIFSFEVGVNMNIINFMVDKDMIFIDEWKISRGYIKQNIVRIITESKNISTKRKIGCILAVCGIGSYKIARRFM